MAGKWWCLCVSARSCRSTFRIMRWGVTAIPFLQYLTATLIGIAPGIAIYVYFGIFGKGLGNGPSFFDWVLFGLGVLATIALAILVIRKTKTKFAEENPT